MFRIEINKKIKFLGLGIFSVLILLAWFFSGPIELAKNIESPGLVIPAGGRVTVDPRSLPVWWQVIDLQVRCEPGQDCAALRAGVQSAKTGQPPFLKSQEEASFRLWVNNPKTSNLDLINPGPQVLRVQQIDLRNYSGINTGFPRFSILLSPFPGSGLPLFTLLGLSLGTALLMIWNLVLLDQRSQSRFNSGFQWGSVLFPWLVLSLALGLRLLGRYLYLSWEFIPAMALPGYLYWSLTGRFFQKKFLAPLLVFLIAATFLILLGTVLGVGLPVRDFGPPFIYQTHFTRTAQNTGLIYLILSYVLYRQKKEWFSPYRHLFLSSIWFVFLPALIIYLANGYSDYGEDTTFNSLLPWQVVQGEGLLFSKEYVKVHGSWGLSQIGEAFLPNFPMGPGFFGLPTALIQYLGSAEPLSRLISWNQKVTAVWVAALSAAVIFQIVYLVGRKLWLSLLLAAAFALGTSQPTISAAVLWQHGPSVLLISLGLFFLIKGQIEKPSFYPLAALPLAFLPLMRTQAVLFYLAALASVVILQPKKAVRFLMWSLPGITATLWINLGLYHSLLGGYAYQASGDNFATPLLEGAIGSLFSPNRGFLVFSPFLALGIIGGAILWARRSVIALTFGLAAFLFFMIHAKYAHWHGGWCVAPRFTCELVPVLVLFSVYWFLEFKKFRTRLVGWALVLISIAINLPGSFFLNEQGAWNLFPNVDYSRQERVWDFKDWLPFHFRYWVRLENQEEVPAFAFVVSELAEPLKSKSFHYRVKMGLTEKSSEIIKLSNVFLRKGSYQVQFKGDSHFSFGAEAKLVLGYVGYKVEESVFPVDQAPSYVLSHSFHMEKSGRIDIRLLVSGKGNLILDTVQIVPVGKGLKTMFENNLESIIAFRAF
jgi:hypothetical protein